MSPLLLGISSSHAGEARPEPSRREELHRLQVAANLAGRGRQPQGGRQFTDSLLPLRACRAGGRSGPVGLCGRLCGIFGTLRRDTAASAGSVPPRADPASFLMASVAQLAEHRIVVPGVAGSNPVARPFNSMGWKIIALTRNLRQFATWPDSGVILQHSCNIRVAGSRGRPFGHGFPVQLVDFSPGANFHGERIP